MPANAVRLLRFATCALVPMIALPAHAQDAVDPATPSAPIVVMAAAPTDCELHVWPAERFTAMSRGLLSSMGVIGALVDANLNAEGDKEHRTEVASALDPEGQIAALRSLNMGVLLSGKPANVYFHPAPLDRKTVAKIATRRAESQSPCYSEVIVLDITFAKTALVKQLSALIWYRDFGNSQKRAKFVFRRMGDKGLKLFPAKPGEDVQAANDELVNAFRTAFVEFAGKEREAPHGRVY